MVSIIARHFPKSRHLGFDLDHQNGAWRRPTDACLAVIGARHGLSRQVQAIAAPVVRIEMSACAISFAMDCLSAAIRRFTSAMVNPGSKLSTISTKTTRPDRLDLTRSSR